MLKIGKLFLHTFQNIWPLSEGRGGGMSACRSLRRPWINIECKTRKSTGINSSISVVQCKSKQYMEYAYNLCIRARIFCRWTVRRKKKCQFRLGQVRIDFFFYGELSYGEKSQSRFTQFILRSTFLSTTPILALLRNICLLTHKPLKYDQTEFLTVLFHYQQSIQILSCIRLLKSYYGKD